MTNGDTLLLDLEAQMQDIGLTRMANKLDEAYRSPDFLTKDRLDLISDILAPEYQDRTTKRLNNRLRTARLIGTPCDISKCVDSNTRSYTPTGAPAMLSSLKFIEDGLNVCILGASDSGKTYCELFKKVTLNALRASKRLLPHRSSCRCSGRLP